MTVQPSRNGDPTSGISDPSDLFATPAGEQQRTADMPRTDHGFGSRLREAREARGLDLESCGHALRLPVRVLRQVESDDHAGMDYQVYLTGYIRKYARHLGIDEAEIDAEVLRIKQSTAVQDSPALVATGGISHSRYLLERYVRAATYVVLTIALVVPVVWYGARDTLNNDASRFAPLDASPVALQSATPAGRGNRAGKKVVEPAVRLPALKPPQVDQPLMASMMPVLNLSSSDSATVAPVPAPAATDVVGSGSHSLQISLDGSSWVEVTNADGDRLEYGLLPAGTVKTYRSNDPLDVRIGNANGAKVSIDGQPVALDGYRHANVAHFRMAVQDGKAGPAGA